MKISAESNKCRRDELDADVCCRLSECGVLTGVCVLEGVRADDEYEYPDIETKVQLVE